MESLSSNVDPSIVAIEKHYCEYCSESFASTNLLACHRKTTHHSDEIFHCKRCSLSYEDRHSFLLHIKAIHTNKSPSPAKQVFWCCYCKVRAFSSRQKLASHIENDHHIAKKAIVSNKKLVCPGCMELFDNRTTLQVHMKRFKCGILEESVNSAKKVLQAVLDKEELADLKTVQLQDKPSKKMPLLIKKTFPAKVLQFGTVKFQAEASCSSVSAKVPVSAPPPLPVQVIAKASTSEASGVSAPETSETLALETCEALTPEFSKASAPEISEKLLIRTAEVSVLQTAEVLEAEKCIATVENLHKTVSDAESEDEVEVVKVCNGPSPRSLLKKSLPGTLVRIEINPILGNAPIFQLQSNSTPGNTDGFVNKNHAAVANRLILPSNSSGNQLYPIDPELFEITRTAGGPIRIAPKKNSSSSSKIKSSRSVALVTPVVSQVPQSSDGVKVYKICPQKGFKCKKVNCDLEFENATDLKKHGAEKHLTHLSMCKNCCKCMSAEALKVHTCSNHYCPICKSTLVISTLEFAHHLRVKHCLVLAKPKNVPKSTITTIAPISSTLTRRKQIFVKPVNEESSRVPISSLQQQTTGLKQDAVDATEESSALMQITDLPDSGKSTEQAPAVNADVGTEHVEPAAQDQKVQQAALVSPPKAINCYSSKRKASELPEIGVKSQTKTPVIKFKLGKIGGKSKTKAPVTKIKLPLIGGKSQIKVPAKQIKCRYCSFSGLYRSVYRHTNKFHLDLKLKNQQSKAVMGASCADEKLNTEVPQITSDALSNNTKSDDKPKALAKVTNKSKSYKMKLKPEEAFDVTKTLTYNVLLGSDKIYEYQCTQCLIFFSSEEELHTHELVHKKVPTPVKKRKSAAKESEHEKKKLKPEKKTSKFEMELDLVNEILNGANYFFLYLY